MSEPEVRSVTPEAADLAKRGVVPALPEQLLNHRLRLELNCNRSCLPV